MANYVKNKLIIKATDKQIEEVKEFLRSKNLNRKEETGEIDFNNITPCPKWIYQGNLGVKEEEKYGIENCWYDWNIKNWGTKWNAFHTFTYGNVIEFETAWSNVANLMLKLGIIFPEIEFVYMYADEDIGYNLGLVEFKDTEINWQEFVDGSKEAQEFALMVWDELDKYKWDEKTKCYEFIEW